MSFTTSLDKAIGIFSPKKAFSRQFYRDQLKRAAKIKPSQRGSRYAAADFRDDGEIWTFDDYLPFHNISK